MLHQQRLHVAHERPAAADHHLDEQRLALLQSHAPIAPYGLIAPVLRQAQVVHCMSGLVQRPEQTREDVVGIEACGDADIARHAFGERVLALIQSPALEGETDALHHFHGQGALLARRELAGERQQRASLLQGDRFADERREPARQRLEHRVDIRGGQSGAELVHQRIVRGEIQRLAEERRLVADQVHHFLQVRRERLELALGAGLEPARFGARSGLGEPRDERGRGGDRMVALPAHLVQVRDLPVGEPLGVRLSAIQEPRDARRRQQRVVFGFQRRELLAANVSAAARHHHRRVPAQQRQSTAESMQTLELLFELLVRRGGHGRSGSGETGRSLPAPADRRLTPGGYSYY